MCIYEREGLWVQGNEYGGQEGVGSCWVRAKVWEQERKVQSKGSPWEGRGMCAKLFSFSSYERRMKG